MMQATLESWVAWYAPLLGLSDWRIEVRWNAKLNDSDAQAQVKRDPVHRTAIVAVNDTCKDWDDGHWVAFMDHEGSAVHELVHIAAVNVEHLHDAILGAIPDKRIRRLLANELDRQWESLINVVATGMVGAVNAARGGTLPSLGQVFTATEGA